MNYRFFLLQLKLFVEKVYVVKYPWWNEISIIIDIDQPYNLCIDQF